MRVIRVVLINNARYRSDLKQLPGILGWLASLCPMWITELLLLSWWAWPHWNGAVVRLRVNDTTMIEVRALAVCATARLMEWMPKIGFTFLAPFLKRLGFPRGICRWCEHANLSKLMVGRILYATRIAKQYGADVIALTGYTGTKMYGETVIREAERRFTGDTILTTGNGLTSIVLPESVREAMKQLEISANETTLAVVGGYGSVGSMALLHLCEEIPFQDALILGPNQEKGSEWAKKVTQRIRRKRSRSFEARASSSYGDLRDCRVIVFATRSVGPSFFPEHVGETRPVLLIDASVPHCVDESVIATHADVAIYLGGAVQVLSGGAWAPCPFAFAGDSLQWPACAVEAVILGHLVAHGKHTEAKRLATRTSYAQVEHATALLGYLHELGYEIVPGKRLPVPPPLTVAEIPKIFRRQILRLH